jgi:hypothetical protein
LQKWEQYVQVDWVDFFEKTEKAGFKNPLVKQTAWFFMPIPQF